MCDLHRNKRVHRDALRPGIEASPADPYSTGMHEHTG